MKYKCNWIYYFLFFIISCNEKSDNTTIINPTAPETSEDTIYQMNLSSNSGTKGIYTTNVLKEPQSNNPILTITPTDYSQSFQNSEYNILINNVSDSVPNPFYQVVEYDDGMLTELIEYRH